MLLPVKLWVAPRQNPPFKSMSAKTHVDCLALFIPIVFIATPQFLHSLSFLSTVMLFASTSTADNPLQGFEEDKADHCSSGGG